MKKFQLVACLVILSVLSVWSTSNIAAETSKRGKITGGVMHSAPNWFKESFLDIAEDVEEANLDSRKCQYLYQDHDGYHFICRIYGAGCHAGSWYCPWDYNLSFSFKKDVQEGKSSSLHAVGNLQRLRLAGTGQPSCRPMPRMQSPFG